MVILGPLEFRGMTDAWTEYLCIEQLADGGVELSSRSRELLGYGDWWLGDVVWPDGYVPDQDNPDADAVLPLTVAGKAVFGRDGDGIVGHGWSPLRRCGRSISDRSNLRTLGPGLKAMAGEGLRTLKRGWKS